MAEPRIWTELLTYGLGVAGTYLGWQEISGLMLY